VTDSLAELAKDSDVLILQNMGPILDFDALSFESQYLLNVSRAAATLRTASPCPAESAVLRLSR